MVRWLGVVALNDWVEWGSCSLDLSIRLPSLEVSWDRVGGSTGSSQGQTWGTKGVPRTRLEIFSFGVWGFGQDMIHAAYWNNGSSWYPYIPYLGAWILCDNFESASVYHKHSIVDRCVVHGHIESLDGLNYDLFVWRDRLDVTLYCDKDVTDIVVMRKHGSRWWGLLHNEETECLF